MIELHLQIRYCDEKGFIEAGLYHDGSVAIRITSSDTWEPLTTATVCLSEYDLHPRPGHVFIKDWSENEGMYQCLRAEGIVGEAVEFYDIGYENSCRAYECPLLVEVL